MKKSIVFSIVVFLVTFSLSAHAIDLGVRGYYWFPEFTGDVRVDKDGARGSTIDLGTDMGVGNESYPSIEVFAGIGRHHINLIYTKADYSSEKTLARDITFMNNTYTSGTFVQTDSNFQMLDLEYRYDLLDMENILAGFSLGPVGKVKYVDGEIRLKSSSTDKSETFRTAIPMVGMGLHIGLIADIFEARAQITGMAYSGNSLYEYMADLSYTPFPFLDIHGGYKVIRLELDDESDVFASYEFAGPYLALTIGF